MSVFEGTARFYRRYRPGVPADVAEVLLRAVPARRPRRLLDLGAGTGLVVQALRDGFDEIIGIEVEPDLLQVTRSTLGLRSGQELR